jgi:hypothetical protein
MQTWFSLGIRGQSIRFRTQKRSNKSYNLPELIKHYFQMYLIHRLLRLASSACPFRQLGLQWRRSCSSSGSFCASRSRLRRRHQRCPNPVQFHLLAALASPRHQKGLTFSPASLGSVSVVLCSTEKCLRLGGASLPRQHSARKRGG